MNDPCRKCSEVNQRDLFLAEHNIAISDFTNPEVQPLTKLSLKRYQEIEQKYKYLFQVAPDAIFITEAETGIIIEANQQAAELLGIPVNKIVGMHQSQLHPKEDEKKYKKGFRDHIRTGSTDIPEDIYVCDKDGQKIPVEIHSTVVEIGNKKFALGIFRDIRDQKQIVEDLDRSRERYKRLSEAAFEGIVISIDGKFFDANQQFLDMVGYTMDEIKNLPKFALVAPQYHQQVKEIILSGQEGPYEAIGVRKDGSMFPYECRAKQIPLSGKTARVAAMRDLTQIKKSQQLLNSVLNCSQDNIVVFDKDLNYLYINETSLKKFHLPGDIAVGKNIRECLTHIPDFMNKWISRIEEVFKTEKPMRIQDQVVIGEEVIYQDVALTPVRYPGGDVFAVSAVDRHITDQIKQSEQMKAVFESSQDCIIVVDKNYNNIYVNKAACDQVNISPDKGTGKTIYDSLGHMPQMLELWKERIDEVFKNQQPMRIQDETNIGDRLVYSESILSPICYPNGEMFAVSIVYRDITEQINAAKAILNISKFPSENPNPVIRISSDGHIIYANSMGHLILSGSDSKKENLIPEAWKQVIDIACSLKSLQTFEVEHAKKIFSFFVVPIADEKYVNLYGYDITERTLLQAQLAESERKYKSLYENAKVALFRTSISTGEILECNRAAAQLFGYDEKEEFLDHCVTEYYVNPLSRKIFLDTLKKNKQVKNFEVQLKRKDGTPFWVSFRAEIFPELDYLEGVMYDITLAKTLTKTELEVLHIVMQGKSNKEIAQILSRSPRTIEDHRAHIMQKLGVNNLVELTKIASSAELDI